jgi:hypothetical protein
LNFLKFSDEAAFLNAGSQLVAVLTDDYPFTATLVDADEARQRMKKGHNTDRCKTDLTTNWKRPWLYIDYCGHVGIAAAGAQDDSRGDGPHHHQLVSFLTLCGNRTALVRTGAAHR